MDAPGWRPRVYLVVRPDGLYSKRSECFSSFNNEMGWVADRYDRRGCFYDSEETAMKEIGWEYPWVRDVARETPPRDPARPGGG